MKTENKNQRFGRKIVLSLATVALLTTSAQAYMGNNNCNMQGQGYGNGSGYSKHYNKGMNNMHKGGVMSLFSELSLTNEQRQKIQDIIVESRKSQITPSDAFTKNSFDKSKFIQMKKEQREKRVEIQADIMEKAYKVLDSKQKEQLRTLLDIRKDRMQQRFENRF